MKRLLVLIVVLTLLVLGGTLVSAEGRTRRHRSKFGRKARTAAIVAGGAGVGALVGGTKGAAIGAGGAGMLARRSSSSARFTLASVSNENGVPFRFCQSTSTGKSCLTFFLLPMKLSSTINTGPRQPRRFNSSNSATICSLLFVRGTRP